MSSADSCGLIVFFRFPLRGKVKTRLAATLGDESAYSIYEELTSATFDLIGTVKMSTYLFYEGGFPLKQIQDTSIHYLHQSQGDLGEKMSDAFAHVLAHHQKAIIIGSDCPELNASDINLAISYLNEADIVLGPTYDGGYYLFGCRKLIPDLFHGISWSSGDVLVQTKEKIKRNNLSFCLLRTLHDIDVEDDWHSYKKRTQ